MDTRREFIKKSVLLSSAAGLSTFFPPSIQRALAIDPVSGSTYLDAEHVVILMQENRSFDHCFGSLQGVRGFNDPRVFKLPNGNPAWLQANKEGKTYAPFRLNIHDTKATWMGSLPHSRASQVDAYSNGKYDQWLIAKKSGHKKYAEMPLTLGYHNREDLPFNYAMADAFTICDQNFSSAMTSTWPNRMFLWTGTIREEQNGHSRAHVRNDLAYGEAKWKTFPERLEENNIPWKIYQNDLSCGGGFEGEQRSWLANFGCNTMEFFSNYNVKFSARYVKGLQQQAESLPNEIKLLKEKIAKTSQDETSYQKLSVDLNKKEEVLANAKAELLQWSPENFEKLSKTEKDLYKNAFSINTNDPYFHELSSVSYQDGNIDRKVTVPKGDVFYQFRKDVNSGTLPTVSWLAPPQNFSDHPSAPWYGAWYVSEILDILTKNPETWKKTIFIVTYDENDGYFDHIPPFLPPDVTKENSGKCSKGIDPSVEYIHLEQELKEGKKEKDARGFQIGLGYRVPMIIASPWSRGGRVCSEVFDHTSSLQFLEKFLNKKYGLNIKEENISQWRRTVCGDLTSVFAPYNSDKRDNISYLKRDPFIEKIHTAQFKEVPTGYKQLSNEEITHIKTEPFTSSIMPKQEKGIRPSCALPYQLYADGNFNPTKGNFELSLTAANEILEGQGTGSPFTIYAPGNFKMDEKSDFDKMINWQYAVAAGDTLSDTWPIKSFENEQYHLCVYGPNGFFREFKGRKDDPVIKVKCLYERLRGNHLSGNVVLNIAGADADQDYVIEVIDHAYKKNNIKKTISKRDLIKGENILLNLKDSFGWYDFSIRINGFQHFEKRYAGHVETGKESYTDPLMGQMI